jgi:hypothetical protein
MVAVCGDLSAGRVSVVSATRVDPGRTEPQRNHDLRPANTVSDGRLVAVALSERKSATIHAAVRASQQIQSGRW